MLVLDNSLGALFIADVVGAALWGIGCAQAWHYFLSKPRDHVIIKVMVVLAWLLDTASQMIITFAVYDCAVTNFGNVLFLFELPPYKLGTTLCVLLIASTLLVQSFYVFRIWRLSAESYKWLLVAPFIVLIIIEVGLGCHQAVLTSRLSTWIEFHEKSGKIPVTAFALIFVVDTLLAMAMCWTLVRTRPEYKRTSSVITRWVLLSLSTGAMTSLCSFGLLLCYTVWPNTILFAPFFQNILRLETNSFLAALNMREYLSERVQNDIQYSASIRNLAHSSVRRKANNPLTDAWSIQMHSSEFTLRGQEGSHKNFVGV